LLLLLILCLLLILLFLFLLFEQYSPMYPCITHSWLVLVLAAALLAGCQDTAGHTYPPDPIFAGKKPIEAKAQEAAPAAVACVEPAMPAVPALVLASAQPNPPAGTEFGTLTPAASLRTAPEKAVLQVSRLEERQR